MKAISLWLMLAVSCNAQMKNSGGFKSAGGMNLGSATSSAVTYCSWAGINSMSTGAISGGQIGSSCWAFAAAAGGSASITDSSDPLCATALTGTSDTKCVDLAYTTASGTASFAAYLYLDPTYATSVPKNIFLDKDVYSKFRLALNANGDTYLGNTNSQVKYILQRNDTITNWSQANNNGAPNYGFLQFAHVGSSQVQIGDDGTTFSTFGGTYTISDTAGLLWQAYEHRYTNDNTGDTRVAVNGVEILNPSLGVNPATVTPAFGRSSVFGSSLASSGTNTVQPLCVGLCYFQICSNACANVTIHVAISSAALYDYNLISYPAAVCPDTTCVAGGPIAWWKASSLSLNDGDPVSSWSDSSNHGNTLTAAASDRPTYKTNQVNSLPIVRFSANKMALTYTLNPADWTVFAVLKPTGAVGGSNGILGGALNEFYWRIGDGAALKQVLLKGQTATIGTSTTALSGAAFSLIGATYDGTNYSFRLTQADDGSGTGAQTLSNRVTTLGAEGNNEKFTGDIEEVLVYRKLGTTDRNAVEAALHTRCGC